MRQAAQIAKTVVPGTRGEVAAETSNSGGHLILGKQPEGRHELHTSMESLIHHFKLVTEGFRAPPGQLYHPIESPRGEFGCYLVSDGGTKPWRIHFRAPSFVSLQSTAMMSVNRYVGDMIVVVGSLDGVMGEADR